MMGKTLAIVTLTLVGALAGLVSVARPALAYSAAQAEAMTDPSHADPYTFPNVKPCCGAKPDPCADGGCRVAPPRPTPCWERPSGCQPIVRAPRRRIIRDCDTPRCRGDREPEWSERAINFRCDGGGDVRSLQEAIDLVQGFGGRIYVDGGFPGVCREALRVSGSVTLIGVSNGVTGGPPELEAPPGPCIIVAGPRASLRIVDMNIRSTGGPACIDVSGGSVRLEGVNVSANDAAAGVAVRGGTLSVTPSARAKSWISGGGPAIMAQSSNVNIADSRFQTSRSYAYVPFAPLGGYDGYPVPRPGYPPMRYIVDDLDEPYGGGRLPDTNPWPGTYGAPTYRPAPSSNPVNPWPGSATPSYPNYPSYPTYPAYPRPPVGPGYGVSPVYNPAPATFSGTPVIVLDESQGYIQRAEVLGGTYGVASVVSSSRTQRDVRIIDTIIRGDSGRAGVVAAGSGGWSGQGSRLFISGATRISDYDTGISLTRVGVVIQSVEISADDYGIDADAYAYGQIYGPRVKAGRGCFRADGDTFSSDRTVKNISFVATSCRD